MKMYDSRYGRRREKEREKEREKKKTVNLSISIKRGEPSVLCMSTD